MLAGDFLSATRPSPARCHSARPNSPGTFPWGDIPLSSITLRSVPPSGERNVPAQSADPPASPKVSGTGRSGRAPGCECRIPGPLARGGVPSATLATLRPLAAVPLDASSPSLHRPPRRPPRIAWGPRLPAPALAAAPPCGRSRRSSRRRGCERSFSGRKGERRRAGASHVERRSEDPLQGSGAGHRPLYGGDCGAAAAGGRSQ